MRALILVLASVFTPALVLGAPQGDSSAAGGADRAGSVEGGSGQDGDARTTRPEPEPPPNVVDIRVEGLVTRDPLKIAGRLGYVIGRPVPTNSVNAQRRLFEDFRILVQGEVRFQEVEGGVIVHISFYEEPVDLDPVFIGNVEFDVERLREWALLDERVEVYSSEIERVEARIETAYKRQGYHFIEVESLVTGEGEERSEIIFQIREGPKVYVKDVEIEGNDSIPDEGILLWRKSLAKSARVVTKGRGLFAWWGHRYVEEVIEQDRIALVQEYRDRGYLDAVVDVRTEFSDDRSAVWVTFVVDEGPRYEVGSISIDAYEVEFVEQFPGGPRERVERPVDLVIPEDELIELLRLQPGTPFERARIAVDRLALLDRYGREGHIDAASFEGDSGTAGWAFLDLDTVVDSENKTVDVTYKIQQGRPFVLRFLEIAGNENTKDRVIRRKFSQLEGERIDAKRIRDDLRRVRNTGYFDDQFARADHPPPSIKYRTVLGQNDVVDAIVTVKEGRTINANLSGGVASDQGLVGIISLTLNNFDLQRLPSNVWSMFGEVYRKEAWTGDGETLGIDISPGSEVNYSRVFYQHPDIFTRYFDPIGFVVEVQLRDRLFRSHDERRGFGRLAFTRAFGQGDVQMSLGVRAQELRVDDFDEDDDVPATLRNSEGEETFVGLTASISTNRLDNRRLPRSGYTARWTNTVYGEALGSDRNLWRSEVSLDRYFHLAADRRSAAPGIYIGLGSGLAVPFDDSTGTVNYGERFFFGGARIGRGFRFRGIGPYDGDFAIGGETYLRSTLEYRFPLYAQSVPGTDLREEVFRGSFFVDAITLGPKAYDLDFEETRISAGIALGLIRPFPVTFSFGWPLRSFDGDERQVFAFSLTYR